MRPAARVGRSNPGICPARDGLACDLNIWPGALRAPARRPRDMGASDDHATEAPARSGDPHRRFDLLYRDHAPKLRRRLRTRLGSADEANDLVHEAFARLLGASRAHELRQPGAFLNRIVRNLLIDRSRRLVARTPHVPLEDDIAVPPAQADGIELEQLRDRYRDIVDALPPRTREVFLLHRVDGLSYLKIAERLDISVRTVEWHVAQAVLRISRGLNGE